MKTMTGRSTYTRRAMKRLRAIINDLFVFLSLVRLRWSPREGGDPVPVEHSGVLSTPA